MLFRIFTTYIQNCFVYIIYDDSLIVDLFVCKHDKRNKEAEAPHPLRRCSTLLDDAHEQIVFKIRNISLLLFYALEIMVSKTSY